MLATNKIMGFLFTISGFSVVFFLPYLFGTMPENILLKLALHVSSVVIVVTLFRCACM